MLASCPSFWIRLSNANMMLPPTASTIRLQKLSEPRHRDVLRQRISPHRLRLTHLASDFPIGRVLQWCIVLRGDTTEQKAPVKSNCPTSLGMVSTRCNVSCHRQKLLKQDLTLECDKYSFRGCKLIASLLPSVWSCLCWGRCLKR